MTDEEPHRVYDRMAEGYADSNPHQTARESYEWPAVRGSLPDLDGKRVLDAACGSGYYAAWMSDRGAEVVGVDASEAMVEQARSRYGDAAQFLHADLREPVPELDPGSFDLVVSQLTLEHVEDWEPVLSTFSESLRPGGALVVSTAHPFTEYFVIDHEPPEIGNSTAESADYYAVERYDVVWGEGEDAVEVPFYRRSLQATLDPVFEAGLVLESLREPTPEVDDHEFLSYFEDHTPRFLVFRARKPPVAK